MRKTTLAFLVLITTTLLVSRSRTRAENAPDEIQRLTIVASKGGYYVPLREGDLKRLTVREGEQLVARGVTQGPDRSRPFVGEVEYSKAYGIAVAFQAKPGASINEQLAVLSNFEPDAVRSVVCIGQADADGLNSIVRFTGIVDLMIEASEILESREGAERLGRLKQLEYLEIVPKDDRKFGSAAFCKAILSLDKLKVLSMPCEKLTDENVKLLATHPSLERIYLFATKPVLGRESLRALNRMKNLREVAITCTDDITDADVMGFAELPKLELLSLWTGAPLTCQERFQARRPDCTFAIVRPPFDLE